MTKPEPRATVVDVAEYLQEHPKTTVKRCRRGEFVGARKKGAHRTARWSIPWKGVEDYLKRQPAGGY